MNCIFWTSVYLCVIGASVEGAPTLTSFAFVQDIGFLELTFSQPLNPTAGHANAITLSNGTTALTLSAATTVTVPYGIYQFLMIGGSDLAFLTANTTSDMRYLTITNAFGTGTTSTGDSIANIANTTLANATYYLRNATEDPLNLTSFTADLTNGLLTLYFSKPVRLSSLINAQLQINTTLDSSLPTIPIVYQSLYHTDNTYSTVNVTLSSHDTVQLATSPLLGANTSLLHLYIGEISDYENNTMSFIAGASTISRPCYNMFNNITLGTCECDVGCDIGCMGPNNILGSSYGCLACKVAVRFTTTNECIALNCTDLNNATCIKCIETNSSVVNATEYCLPDCPLNTYEYGGQCLPCNSLCKGCVGFAENCTECEYWYVEAYPNVTCGLPCELGFAYNTNTSTCELTNQFRYVIIPATCGGGGLLVICWASAYLCCCCCHYMNLGPKKKETRGMVKIDDNQKDIELAFNY